MPAARIMVISMPAMSLHTPLRCSKIMSPGVQGEALALAHGLAAVADVLGHPVQQGLGLAFLVGLGQALRPSGSRPPCPGWRA